MEGARLGLAHCESWRDVISVRTGLVLIVGPSIAGATRTVQALVCEFRGLGKSIYNITDSLGRALSASYERKTDQVPPGVKAYMRGDPDVIVVPVLHDKLSAANAIEAAERGHLVLATINAERVRTALQQLIRLGVTGEGLKVLLRGIIF